MQAILRLDLAGQPRGWLTLQETITAYARGDVIYGIGDPLPPVYGGIPRLTGHRSTLVVQPIIATEGKIYDAFIPPLCNRTLFTSADPRCPSCGHPASTHQLTRDHVLPASRGGTNKWENVVAACKRCNWQNDNKTPEEAGMPLLAVPFRPNPFEWHFLAKDRVLTDQMEYLSKRFKADRDWAH